MGLITKRHSRISTTKPMVNQKINLLSYLLLFLTILVILAARLIFFSTYPIRFLDLISIPYCSLNAEYMLSAISLVYLTILCDDNSDMPYSFMCSVSPLVYHIYFSVIILSPFCFSLFRLCFRSVKYSLRDSMFRYWEVMFSPYLTSFYVRNFSVSSYLLR